MALTQVKTSLKLLKSVEFLYKLSIIQTSMQNANKLYWQVQLFWGVLSEIFTCAIAIENLV